MPPQRTGMLVIRVWLEPADPSGFRARVTHLRDVERDIELSQAFGASADTIAFITQWIRRFEHQARAENPS